MVVVSQLGNEDAPAPQVDVSQAMQYAPADVPMECLIAAQRTINGDLGHPPIKYSVCSRDIVRRYQLGY